MGKAQSCCIATLPVCAIYLFYKHMYCSRKLLKLSVVDCNHSLPSFGYLFVKYVIKALSRSPGHLYTRDTEENRDVSYTVLNCRLETPLLRKFCSAAGYGWDYPDSEYRDIPLCFPEIICVRLLLMVISAAGFRLSPVGLIRVRQSLKTLQPIDELKKGPFVLQARVLEYRLVDAGVEVDVSLSATSRSNQLVWESVLTLLSLNKFHKAARLVPKGEVQSQSEGSMPADMKRVDVRVPWSAGWRCVWSFTDYSPHHLLALPARLLGYTCHPPLSLWMLSVCLAEIEKHKGVKAVTAPVSLTVQFKEPPLVPGEVVLKFWETTAEDAQSSPPSLRFHVEQCRTRIPHLAGVISRTWNSAFDVI